MVLIPDIMLYTQLGTVVVCLLYASVVDIIKREVSDIPWIIMALEGLITTIIFLVYSENRKSEWITIAINLGLGIIIGLTLYYTGIMGGADAKALMALSINTAIYPFNFELTSYSVYSYLPPVFNTFFNWLLVMIIIYPIPLLIYNLILKIKGTNLFEEVHANIADKILMLISGFIIPVEKATKRVDVVYSEIYDDKNEKWKIKHFMAVQEIEEEEEFKKQIEEKVEKTEKKRIWVKVLPPGILFLLIGYIINVLAGNVFFAILLQS